MPSAIQSGFERFAPPIAQQGSAIADGRFEAVLNRVRSESGERTESSVRKTAEEFVGLTLVQPILAMLREQTDAAPPFAPGPGEKAFGPLLDAEIAMRITRAKGFGLVDVVARNLLKTQGAPSAQEAFPDVR